VLGPATGNTDTQDSPRPGLGGSHHLPPYSILCDSPRGPHPNGFSLPGLPGLPGLVRGSPEIPPCGTPGTLKPHNFESRPWIEVRFEAKLYLSSRAFQRYVARRLQSSISGRFPTFSGRESKLSDSREFDSRPFFWS
jgi:hypothetical protein